MTTPMSPRIADACVWHSTVDGGNWTVQVWGRAPYQGRLLIWNQDNLTDPVLDEDVGLAYDAKFGPDVDDVDLWKERAIEVIDSYV